MKMSSASKEVQSFRKGPKCNRFWKCLFSKIIFTASIIFSWLYQCSCVINILFIFYNILIFRLFPWTVFTSLRSVWTLKQICSYLLLKHFILINVVFSLLQAAGGGHYPSWSRHPVHAGSESRRDPGRLGGEAVGAHAAGRRLRHAWRWDRCPKQSCNQALLTLW